ncbi:MAG: alpha/beta hydrolase [Methanoculleus sp. SDB]|nr:MAG: alpha/beta hydrolase [Methanoculleus sp. SDB]
MNPKKYGKPPFRVAVVHGGPGAAGEMAPVARELSAERGVLEPLQTVATLEGQVAELRNLLESNGDLPVTLIGFSWGAILSYILTAQHTSCVEKLILVGSPPFEETSAEHIMETRLARLSPKDRKEVMSLMIDLDSPATSDKNRILARFGILISKADSYDPLPPESDAMECRYDIFQGVWEDAREMRSSGALLELGKKIRCPVVAIHGEYDPHSYKAVLYPLSPIITNFRFVLLEKCGHRPWIERYARDRFFAILGNEL